MTSGADSRAGGGDSKRDFSLFVLQLTDLYPVPPSPAPIVIPRKHGLCGRPIQQEGSAHSQHTRILNFIPNK